MRINNWSALYTFGYALVSVGVKTFYKRSEVTGKQHIPKNKPILFAANHQNAFMDPVVIAVNLSRPTYYLVRADVFKKKTVAKIFDSINMMPVYRQRDGGDPIKKNEAIFARCQELLSKNRTIMIFAEGNQGKFKQLRPLKKGVFRIGLGALDKYSDDLDVHIVPVGINYSDLYNMGSTVLINFGEPIRLKDHFENFQKSDSKTYAELTKVLTKKMSSLMIDIKEMDYYDLIHNSMIMLEQDILQLEGIKERSLSKTFVGQKSFIEKAENHIRQNQEKADDLKSVEKEFTEGMSKHDLRSWLFEKESHSTGGHLLGLALLSPLHLYGMINSYLPYRIPARFVEKKIKDLQFHSSLKMAMGVFLFFTFWIIQTSLVALFTDHYIWLMYLASLIITAPISYRYWISLLKFRGKKRYNQLKSEQPEEFNRLRSHYLSLKTFVKDLYQ